MDQTGLLNFLEVLKMAAVKYQSLEEIAALKDKTFLSPMEVSGVMGCDPYNLNLIAKQKPHLMPFPWFFVGNRLKIPRVPWLRFMGWEGEITEA